jgi:hypothetical protein
MKDLQSYCGADLLCYRSLKDSTYTRVRLAFSLACAVHIGFLITCCKALI